MGERYLRHDPIDPNAFPPRTPKATIDHWGRVFGLIKQEKPKPAQMPITERKQTTKDNIRLGCGCNATFIVHPDGSYQWIEHHIKGCTGNDDD